MKSRIPLVLLVGTVVALVPTVAAAKGPTAVEITGPGLDEPIRLERAGDSRSDAGALVEAAGVARVFGYPAPDGLTPTAPPGPRGPRYVATYYTPVFADEGQDGYETVRQDLYPFAEGGALVYTPPGQSLLHQKSRGGGWNRADPTLTDLVVALGVPTPAEVESRPVSEQEGTDQWCRPAVEVDVAQVRAESGATGSGPAVEITLTGSRGHRQRAHFSGAALDIGAWTPRIAPNRIAKVHLVVPTKDQGAPPIVDAEMAVRPDDLARVHGRGCARLCVRVTRGAVVACSSSTYRDEEHGLAISYPSSWRPATATVAPLLIDPVIPLALGTYDFPTEGCGAVPGPALQALGPKDAFIAVYVFRGAGATWDATIPERPTRFGPGLPWSEGVGKCAEDVRGTIRSLNFPDRGLRLDAIGSDASAPRQRELYRILDTLTVEPRPG